MVQFLCKLLLVLVAQCVLAHQLPLFWYSSSFISNFPSKDVDFRGCYENECAYISTTPLFSTDKLLGPYTTSQQVWVVSDSSNTSLSWIFSQERPEEMLTTSWISRVPKFKVSPSSFDATPYRTDEPDPLVARVVASISEERLRFLVDRLANGFYTRNTFSEDAVEAAHFLQSYMSSLGCQSARLHEYYTGYAPNVICELPGYDAEAPMVVVGAHFDSRASSTTNPSERAPGADDNGTGTSGLLEIIRAIAQLISDGVSFRRKITFMLFSGEEQGLYGSDAIASELSDADVELIGMVNLDMIGYPQQNQPNTLWWKARSVNQDLTDLGIALTKTYLGENTLISTSVSCCSDQQSFYQLGYPAAGVFEATAGTNNPNYHRASDLPNTVTYSHARRTTQMGAALIATLAEPRGPDTQNININ